MPTLSIVLPVYGVAGYLRECLDSILEQQFTDVEVIAVDDCSLDSSGEILDEYARRDPRLKVLHLPHNEGLGGARNAGTAAASGTYVWFVDSDDWLAPGALGAIARRLAETKPDVLLVDYANVSVARKPRRSTLRWRVPVETTPDVFSAPEVPGVFRTLHTAWSRIIRREWLTSLDIPFRSGWYEDVSFTYAVTAAAQRIAVLWRVCYMYRIARQGAITASAGNERHFEVFDQYRTAYADFDRLGIHDPAVRAAMFNRMQMHYRWILGQTQRVPKRRRREFFRKLSADFRERRPAEPLASPSRLERRKQALIYRDAWRIWRLMIVLKGITGGVTGAYRKTVGTTKTVLKGARRGALLAYYWAQRRRPLDENLAVYSAYWARGYRCSPAAVYEKAAEIAPQIHGVFVVRPAWLEDMPDGVDYVVQGSRRYFKVLARAKYLVNNVNFENRYVKRAGQTYLQTHHGTPLKAMGMDHYRYPLAATETDLVALLRKSDQWDFSVSTSAFNTEVWQRAYPCGYETLEVGYPRNDRLVRATAPDIAAARARLGIRDDEITIMYAPTHREYHTAFQSILDVEALADALGPAYRILVRAHYYYRASSSVDHPQVLDVSAESDVEELYLAADVVITDYSSIMFDYAYLDRPQVIFAPDWDAYQTIRGVTFDLMQTPPGAVATTEAELTDIMRTGEYASRAATEARARFIERFCPHTDGLSSERVARRFFLGDVLATRV